MKSVKKEPLYPRVTSEVFSVREAKAQFSALVARAAEGEELIVSWHGQPRARLMPLREVSSVFRVDHKWLGAMPVRGHRKRAENLVRNERDERG